MVKNLIPTQVVFLNPRNHFHVAEKKNILINLEKKDPDDLHVFKRYHRRNIRCNVQGQAK